MTAITLGSPHAISFWFLQLPIPGLRRLNFLDVVALSRKASGTKHPAPLSVVPAESGAAPAVTKDDEGHFIFTTTIHLSAGEDLPIALVVKGTAPQ
jgi:hypothetical protein